MTGPQPMSVDPCILEASHAAGRALCALRCAAAGHAPCYEARDRGGDLRPWPHPNCDCAAEAPAVAEAFLRALPDCLEASVPSKVMMLHFAGDLADRIAEARNVR